jgi:hypothetical protein
MGGVAVDGLDRVEGSRESVSKRNRKCWEFVCVLSALGGGIQRPTVT